MFDLVSRALDGSGYLGILLLMFLENLFPPIPSELIMPLAGFAAARGGHHIVLVIVAGAVGSLLGALFWYGVGYWIGEERLKRFAARHGRWLTLSPADVDRSCRWFQRHCGKAVFFGRLVPTVRTFISVPAGIADMPLRRFLVYSSLGTALWTALLALAGYYLEEGYEQVAAYLNPVSNAVLAGIVLWYLYRVATFRRRVTN